ncbi:MAG: hypothetical protein GC162_11570 [Planctomycetes bacterium]|nr:hypothetical protein [Planctomycetota bacterium]
MCLTIAVTLGSCQQPTRLKPADPPRHDFESPVAANVIDQIAVLLPLKTADRSYLIVEGDATGSHVVLSMTEDPTDAAFPWRVTDGERVEHLGRADDGSIVLGAVEDKPHNALTIYDPPMPLLPAGLEPGKSMQFTSKMTIVGLDHPDQQRDRGTATRTITHIADQTVITPSGSVRTRKIKSEEDAKLGLASVHVEDVHWYAPKRGLMAEDHTENVTALFLHWTTHRLIIAD